MQNVYGKPFTGVRKFPLILMGGFIICSWFISLMRKRKKSLKCLDERTLDLSGNFFLDSNERFITHAKTNLLNMKAFPT